MPVSDSTTTHDPDTCLVRGTPQRDPVPTHPEGWVGRSGTRGLRGWERDHVKRVVLLFSVFSLADVVVVFVLLVYALYDRVTLSLYSLDVVDVHGGTDGDGDGGPTESKGFR